VKKIQSCKQKVEFKKCNWAEGWKNDTNVRKLLGDLYSKEQLNFEDAQNLRNVDDNAFLRVNYILNKNVQHFYVWRQVDPIKKMHPQ